MRRLITGAALALSAIVAGCAVSTQQEVQMGRDYSAQINAQLPIVQDPEVNRYINVLGDSIARLTARGELDWHFYVVNAPEVNAFAVPGGFIYVNRGLIERSRNMSELAGALGHEIGHVVKRHSIKQMQKMSGANLGLMLGCVLTSICATDAGQTAVNIGGSALFAKFSRADEAEADQEGIANLVRAGIDPRGIPELFEVLIDERQRKPEGVESWFATHPGEEDRLHDTEATISRIDPAVLRTLTRDSEAYQRFRRRVQALPPAPVTRR